MKKMVKVKLRTAASRMNRSNKLNNKTWTSKLRFNMVLFKFNRMHGAESGSCIA